MRILQVYDLPPSAQGPIDGVGLAIVELSRALVRLGHEVTLLAGSGKTPEPATNAREIRIVTVDRFGLMRRTWSPTNLTFGRQLFFPLTVLTKREILRELAGFDIINGHVYSGGLVALLLGKQLNIPVCNTVHGSYYSIWDQIVSPRVAPIVRFAEKRVVLYLARNAARQIHADEFFATMVTSWGADPSKLRVIRNGVSDELIARFTEPSGIGTPVFFTARRLVRKNGLDFLLKAFSLVVKQRIALLRIAGEGPEYAALSSLASRLHIKDSVEFLGGIPHSSISEFIRNGTVAVLPSLAEASSLFLLECMALGRPVVCSSVGGLKEVVDDRSAWLVRPGDETGLAEAMLLAVENWEDSLAKIRRAHQIAAEKYSWRRAAMETAKCYGIRAR